MKSKQQKIYSVFSVIFYLLVFLSPFIGKAVFAALGYSGGSVPIAVIAMMVFAVILGAVAVINKERIVTVVSIVTCAVGTVGMIIFESKIGDASDLDWLFSGYLFLLLSVLALILGKKTGKQKVFRVVQIVIVVLLVANVAVNIYLAANEFYGFFGIAWDNIYFRIASVTNSLANVFWGLWIAAYSRCSE